MKTIGAYEAKTHLPRLLDEVELGEEVTITKHGRAVARLIPVAAAGARPAEVIAALRESRRGVRRGRVPVRRMIDEGRR
jgi:prevent-host-death family protein